ncbi:hypothetical protein PG996_012260 [Apiospora saccharicola]|uniref:SMP-30/Gluconolactonase/LRE-like region domain-containing protein n=1 Tax=Apiospora saccharicola TaxID=335842 RepID=A0ABR1U228_9PEZI
MEVQVRLLTQLPSNGLYEGFVVVPNGSLLVARADAPELYQVDYNDNGKEEIQLLDRFQEVPDINSIINICAIPGTDEEFIVLLGFFDMQAMLVSNYQIWRFSISGNSSGGGGSASVRWTRVTSLDDAGFFLSIVAISDRVLLVTDSARHRVYSVDLITGRAEVLVTHDSFKPTTKDEVFGINRLCLDDMGTVWFTNSTRSLVGKFCIDASQDGTAETTRLAGDVEIVAEGFPASDGFAVLPDGSAAYLATMYDGKLLRVSLMGTDKGSITDVKHDLVEPTAVGLVPPRPGSEDGRKHELCVICHGQVDATWNRQDHNSGWRDIADIVRRVKGTVTVTED